MDTLWVRWVYSHDCCDRFKIVQSFLRFAKAVERVFGRPVAVDKRLKRRVKQEYRINTDSPSSVRMRGVRFYDNNE